MFVIDCVLPVNPDSEATLDKLVDNWEYRSWRVMPFVDCITMMRKELAQSIRH